MIYFKIRTEFTEVKFGRVKNQWRGKKKAKDNFFILTDIQFTPHVILEITKIANHSFWIYISHV